MSGSENLEAQLGAVVGFLELAPLRATVAELEVALDGCQRADVPEVIAARGVTEDLLRSAVAARNTFGKINDVIHAAAIALSLPHLLDPGERLSRPSLAAGNTPDRLFDVETDARVAEFKLARWDGHDSGRQKTCSGTTASRARARQAEGRAADPLAGRGPAASRESRPV